MENRIRTNYRDSYIDRVFAIIGELIRYWVLSRDTYKTERIVGLITIVFGLYVFQVSGTASSVSYLPEHLAPFDSVFGFALVVCGVLSLLGLWLKMRLLRIFSSILTISLWSGLEMGFIATGKLPGVYILPIFIFEITIAFLRNCWIKNNGAVSDGDKRHPAFHIHYTGVGAGSFTGTVGESAVSAIIEETRRRFFSSQGRAR